MPVPFAALAARLLPLALGVGESGGAAAVARGVGGRALTAGAAQAGGAEAGAGATGSQFTMESIVKKIAEMRGQDTPESVAEMLKIAKERYQHSMHGTGEYVDIRENFPIDWNTRPELATAQVENAARVRELETRLAVAEKKRQRTTKLASAAAQATKDAVALSAGAGAAGAAPPPAPPPPPTPPAGGGAGGGMPPGGPPPGGPPPGGDASPSSGPGGVPQSLNKLAKPLAYLGGAAGIATGAMIVFETAIGKLSKEFGELAEKTVESNRGLSQWSGAIASSFTSLDQQRQAEEMRLAKGTETSVLTSNRAFSQFLEETRDIRQFSRQAANQLATVAAKTGQILAAGVKIMPVFQLLQVVLNKADKWLQAIVGAEAEGPDIMNEIVGRGLKAGLNRPNAPIGQVVPAPAPMPQGPKPLLPPMPGGR